MADQAGLDASPARRSSMSTTARLEALERALETARKNALAIVATQDLGGVKREICAFLSASPALQDLVPARTFASDAHASTEALVGALERARDRMTALARDATTRAQRARDLLERARVLKESKSLKADAKSQAIELLRDTFTSVYEEHVPWLRRQVRTQHAPSTVLATALRAALPSAGTEAHRKRIGELVATLDSLATRTTLKADINAFLDGAALGQADLRPRRWLRTDHAPTEVLVELLEALAKEYGALADPAETRRRLDRVDELVERLKRRRTLKTERDECLKRAKALKGSLRDSAAHTQGMIDQIERDLRGYEEQADALRRRIAQAAEDRWQRQLALEGAQRALEVLGWCADVLDDDFALPDSFDALTTRKAALHLALASGKGPLEAARRDVATERASYEKALAAQLATAGSKALPAADTLKARQGELTDHERRDALATLELELLSAVKSSDDFDGQLFRAVLSSAVSLAAKSGELEAAIERAERAVEACDATLVALENELARSEVAARDAIQVRSFCLSEHAAIDAALTRYRQLKREYRETESLAYYISSSEDLYERLLGIGRLVRGRRESVDSMGSVRVALLIDVGVRAGLELGFVEITAELRLTLLLEGTLSVLDSREVMFQSHVALFLSANATARAGLADAADALGAGDLLTVPDLLVEASAKCQANIHDARACSVYTDERHWAARWAHAIARRQAFLRSVKLTREGFESLDESWLDAQVARLASEGGSLAFLTRLSSALGRSPRELEIDTARRFEGRASLKAGEHELGAGTDPGSARYTLAENVGGRLDAVGDIEEHSLDFVPKKQEKEADASGASSPRSSAGDPPAPSGFRGTTTYHTLGVATARPRSRSEPRAFLEVTMQDAHGLSLGPFHFESAGTSTRALGGVTPQMARTYRALATSLDVEASDRFDRVVKLPEALEKELESRTSATRAPSRKAAEALARTMRLRLDLVIARGEPAALTKVLHKVKTLEEDVEEHLKTAADKAEQARSLATRLDELLRSNGSELASASPIASSALRGLAERGRHVVGGRAAEAAALAEAAKEKAELLQQNIQSRVAELKECLTLLDNSHAVYARYVRSFRCSAPPAPATARLAWEPAWVPQVHRGICRRRFSVSTEKSFPVLPLVKVFVGTRIEIVSESSEFEAIGIQTWSYLKSLAFSMSDEVWTAWWALHKGEILDLCVAVAKPGSVPFSEVVLDALEGRAPLQRAARALGEACWDVFRTEENPFAERAFDEAMVIKALQGRLGARPQTSASGAAITPHAPAPRLPLPSVSAAEAALTRLYLVALRQDLARPWIFETQASGKHTFEWLVTEARATLSREKELKLGIVRDYEGAGVERGWLDGEAKLDRLARVLTLFREGETRGASKATAMPTPGPSAPERLTAARALAAIVEEKVSGYTEIDPLLGVDLRPLQILSLEGDGRHAVSLLADALAVTRGVLTAESGLPSPEQWKSRSAVSWLMRSGATGELDQAVVRFHAAPVATATFDGRIPPTLDDAVKIALEHVRALQARLRVADELDAAVRAWFGAREKDHVSKRAPAVAAVLELPLGALRRRLYVALAFLLLRIELATRLDALDVLHEGLSAAERRAAALLQRTFQHGVDVAKAERLTQTTVKLQRVFRTNKARRDHAGPNVDALERPVLAYLKEAAADFRHDALVHGRKKTLLRGESFPLHTVPEPEAAKD